MEGVDVPPHQICIYKFRNFKEKQSFPYRSHTTAKTSLETEVTGMEPDSLTELEAHHLGSAGQLGSSPDLPVSLLLGRAWLCTWLLGFKSRSSCLYSKCSYLKPLPRPISISQMRKLRLREIAIPKATHVRGTDMECELRPSYSILSEYAMEIG